MIGKGFLWPKCWYCGHWLSNARIQEFAMRWQLGTAPRDCPYSCQKCENLVRDGVVSARQ